MKQLLEITEILLQNRILFFNPVGSRANQVASYNIGNTPFPSTSIKKTQQHETKLVRYDHIRKTNLTTISIQYRNCNQR